MTDSQYTESQPQAQEEKPAAFFPTWEESPIVTPEDLYQRRNPKTGDVLSPEALIYNHIARGRSVIPEDAWREQLALSISFAKQLPLDLCLLFRVLYWDTWGLPTSELLSAAEMTEEEVLHITGVLVLQGQCPRCKNKHWITYECIEEAKAHWDIVGTSKHSAEVVRGDGSTFRTWTICKPCQSEIEDISWYEGTGDYQSMPYSLYLKTCHWGHVREDALLRAEYRCQLCNSDRHLQVHHRTYENIGHERNQDLVVLCADCHHLFHSNKKLVVR